MYKTREKRNSTTLRCVCRKCSKGKNWFGLMRSACFYEGVIKKCVHLFKYKKTIKLRKFFNSILLKSFKLHLNKNYDLIVAVPMSPFKKFFREFNHADILAHDLSLKLGISYRKDTLRRTRLNKSQTRLNSTQRKKNVKGSFGLLRIDEIQKKKILLIDDVATTLSTVNECAKTLMQGGAKSVDVFTLARG